MEPVLVVFIIFGSIGTLIYKFLEGRHKERMSMIDKGVSAETLTTSSFPKFRISPLSNLKWGLIFSFIGIGIALGTYLDEYLGWRDGAYPSMMFLMGGLALVIFYAISKNRVRDEA